MAHMAFVPPPKARAVLGGASLVAAGTLLSRIAGFARQYVFNHFFGLSDAADAYSAAFKIPNFLQNLFGEGALSASFIPVYARLLAEKDEEEAGRVAGAVAAVLSLAIAVLVLLGVLATPWLIDAIAYGFEGAKRELAIRLVRIFFPGAGLLVLSAWCLGVLNSHRRFFLSYAAPVIWNAAIVAALLWFGGRMSQFPLAEMVAWGSVAGSALQVIVQLPSVLRLARGLRVRFDTRAAHVREVLRNFVPVFFSRGVVQVSAYIDTVLASPLPNGAVAGLYNAQTLFMLPVSMFGGAIVAAELPAMSSAMGSREEVSAQLRERLDGRLRQIAYFVVPSAVVFLALGDVLVAALYQTGQFTASDSIYVWGILAGYGLGLLASTFGRLYSSAFWALRDTRTPLRFAVVRVTLATGLGYAGALHMPAWAGIEPRWGAAALALASGAAAWVEFVLLRGALNARIGRTGIPAVFLAKVFGAALAAAALGWAVKLFLGEQHPWVSAAFILGPFGLTYLGLTYVLGLPQGRELADRLLRRAGG